MDAVIENNPGGLGKRRLRRTMVSGVVTVRLKLDKKGMSNKEHWGWNEGKETSKTDPDANIGSTKYVLTTFITC